MHSMSSFQKEVMMEFFIGLVVEVVVVVVVVVELVVVVVVERHY